MAGERELKVVVLGDATKAQKALRNLDDSLGKSSRQVKSTGQTFEGLHTGIGNVAKVASVALVGGLVAGAVAFKGFIDQAEESRQIGRLTEQVIKSTGGAAKLTATQVGNLATAVSNKTGVDDEAIQSGENLLLTFTNLRNEAGKGNDIFSQTTAIMTDMSVALGQDTKTSAIQLGKALNDPVKGVSALQKVGVSFTAAQKKQIKTLVDAGKTMEAQKVILHELGREFGGAAAAASTPWEKMQVTLGNAAEAIGGVLLPYVDEIAPKIADLATHGAGALGKALGLVGNALGWLVDKGRPVVDFIRQAIVGFTGANTKLGHINVAALQVGGRLRGFAEAVKGFFAPAVDFARQVIAGFTGANTKFKHINTTAQQVGGVLRDVFHTVRQKVAELWPKLKDLGEVIVQKVKPAVGDLVDLVGKLIAKWGPRFLDAAKTGFNDLKEAIDKLKPVVGAVLDKVKDVIGWLDDHQDVVEALVAGFVAFKATLAAYNGVVAVTSGVTKAWAAVQALLNAVLDANPIGLIALAIGALVFGLVMAYKHSETFHKVVDKVFHAVGSVASWLWNSVLKPVFKFIGDHWGQVKDAIGKGAVAIVKVWAGVASAGLMMVRGVIKYWGFMLDKFTSVVSSMLHGAASVARALGMDGVAKKLDSAGDAVSSFGKTAVSALKSTDKGLADVQKGIDGMPDKVETMFKGDTSKLKDATDRSKVYINGVPNDKATAIMGHIHDLQEKVVEAKNHLKSVPDSKRSKILGEITDLQAKVKSAKMALASVKDKTVHMTVVVRTTSGGVSYVQGHGGKLVIDGVPRKDGGIVGTLQRFATGGYAGLVSGPGGPRSDSIPALISNGEYVVNAKATAQWLPVLNAINSGRSATGKNAGGAMAMAGAAPVVVNVHVQGSVTAERHLASSIAGAVRDQLVREGRRNGGRTGL